MGEMIGYNIILNTVEARIVHGGNLRVLDAALRGYPSNDGLQLSRDEALRNYHAARAADRTEVRERTLAGFTEPLGVRRRYAESLLKSGRELRR